ncbi:MAG TPA: phage holin family protein [Miltoncostaeaceae bacterium]|jgi:uncharacterized membrane protein YqjE|nr:phage holin family protein [Miltoncostaeaceae bacterium]
MTTNGTHPPLREVPLGRLLGRLRGEFGELAHEEMRLLRAEMDEKKRRAISAAGLGGAALVAALIGLGVFAAFLVLLLDLVMPAWLAALIVAVLFLAGAAVAAMAARTQLRHIGSPVPQKTISNVKEDVQWLTTRARSSLG